jgi:MYXO-CTERM domain-containing protein
VLAPAQQATTGSTNVERAKNDLHARSPALKNVSLALRGEHALPGGNRMVRFRQEHAGLPVLQRGASVMLDKAGKPTKFATARVETRFVGSSTPALSRSVAADRANHVVRGMRYSPARAQLAWLPALDGAHLGWVFYQGVARGTPFAPVVVIDAANGDVLLRVDATRFDRAASVYEVNPITTPTLSSVTLDALTTGATNLENAQIQALNCIDEKTTTGGDFDIHFCELKPTAVADANGDFPYPYLGDAAAEDPFAEVTMFYHTAKAYSFLTALGMPELNLKPLLTIANLRFPAGWDDFNFGLMQDPNIPLEPYDNAFYTPQDPLGGVLFEDGGGLWFGQGTQADFAYDGDVVYHEFGHAMVDRTVNLTQHWHLDSQGGSPSPGAMNEGLADYFSSALAGDSEVGEYAAKNIFAGFAGSIRNLENDDTCPADISGEVHVDSTFFSGALWKVRQALPEDQRDEFDAALLAALIGAPTGDLGYEEMAALFTAALSASSLGQSAADALAAELVSRGALPECKRVLEYTGPISGPSQHFGNAFYAPGRWLGGVGNNGSYTPGVFQAHRSISAGMEKLSISIVNVPYKNQGFGQNSDPYEPALLVHFSDEPISFTYDNYVLATAGEPIALQGSGYTTVDVPQGATDVYVMVVNLGDEDGLYTSLTLSLKGPPTSTGGTGGTSGFGGFGGSLGGSGGTKADEEVPELTPGGGCACEVRDDGRGAAGAWLFGLAALAFLRRRRAS